jgi:hypothetical protein
MYLGQTLQLLFLTLLVFSSVEAAEAPSITMEAPGIIVRTGKNAAIYTFPPAGFDFNRPRGYWPYPYPPLPHPHPAFPIVPVYPSYGAPAPYVPLGSPYAAPPVEVRPVELKPGGRLVIEVQPADAAVYVDGMQLSSRTEHGYEIGLLAGRHRLDLRRKGMKNWGQDLDVPAGGGLLISVQMEPLPSADPQEQTPEKSKGSAP